MRNLCTSPPQPSGHGNLNLFSNCTGLIGTKRVEDESQKYRFVLVTQQGTLDLAASSEEQLLDWITAIDLILADNHAKGTQATFGSRKPSDTIQPTIPITAGIVAPIKKSIGSLNGLDKKEKEKEVEKKKGILRSNTTKETKKKKEEKQEISPQLMKSLGDLNKSTPEKLPIDSASPRKESNDDSRLRIVPVENSRQRYSTWNENSNIPDYQSQNQSQSEYGGYTPGPPRMQLYDMYGHPVPQMYYQDYSQPLPEEHYRMRNVRYDYPPEMDPRFDPRYRVDLDPRFPYLEDPRFASNDPRFMSMQSDPRYSKDAKPVDIRYMGQFPVRREPYPTDGPPRVYPQEQPLRSGYSSQEPLPRRDVFLPQDSIARREGYPIPDPYYRQNPYTRRGPEGYPEIYYAPRDIYGYPLPIDRQQPLENRTSAERISLQQQQQRSSRGSLYELAQRRDIIPFQTQEEEVRPKGPFRRQSEISDDSQVFEGQKERGVGPKVAVRRSQSVRQPAETESRLNSTQQEQLERIQKIASGKDKEDLKEKRDPIKSRIKSEEISKLTNSVGNLKNNSPDRIEFKSQNPKPVKKSVKNDFPIDKLSERPKSISFADSSPSEEYEKKTITALPRKAVEPQTETRRPKSSSPNVSIRKTKGSSEEELKNMVSQPSESIIRGKSKDDKSAKKQRSEETLNFNNSGVEKQEKSKKKSRLSAEIDPNISKDTTDSMKIKETEAVPEEEIQSSSKALSTISASIDIDPNDGRIKQSQMINPEISHAFYEGGIEPEILDASQDFSVTKTLSRRSLEKNQNDTPEPVRLKNKRPTVSQLE